MEHYLYFHQAYYTSMNTVLLVSSIIPNTLLIINYGCFFM